jgi:hypothetical protein
MKLYTLAEAAEKVGRSPAYLRIAIRRGILSHSRFGKALAFSDQDLAAYLDRVTKKAQLGDGGDR